MVDKGLSEELVNFFRFLPNDLGGIEELVLMVCPSSLKEPFSKEEVHAVLLGLGGEGAG